MRPLFVELVNEVRLKPAVTVQCQEGVEIETQCRRTIGEENGTGDSSGDVLGCPKSQHGSQA